MAKDRQMTYKQLGAKLRLCRTTAEYKELADAFLAENAKFGRGQQCLYRGQECVVTHVFLSDKEITYNLQHYGGAFRTSYVNIPESMIVAI